MEATLECTDRADFGLAWGIKRSFVSYIQRAVDGQITVKEGAAVTAEKDFYFPVERIRSNDHQLLVIFGGAVQFQAHWGLLSIKLQTPRLLVRGETAELAVSDQQGGWLHLAHLTLPTPADDSGGLIWVVDKISLTHAGVGVFGDTYPEGELLDPLTFRIPVPSWE